MDLVHFVSLQSWFGLQSVMSVEVLTKIEVGVCVWVCDPRGGSALSPAEQQVITGLNGLNKHDNGRSALRQSEVRR